MEGRTLENNKTVASVGNTHMYVCVCIYIYSLSKVTPTPISLPRPSVSEILVGNCLPNRVESVCGL